MSSNLIKRIGRYWNSGGGTPDWASVNANQQRSNAADIPAGESGQYWGYRMGGRVGRNTAGTKRFRFYFTSTTTGNGSGGASSRIPNAVLKYTEEKTTDTLFAGSNEGEWIWANLTEPVLINIATGYAVGIAARDAGTSVGMIQAATLNALPPADRPHNTWFYDRATDGSGIPQNSYTGTVNAGNLAVVIEGEKNVAPNQPGVVAKSGPVNSQQPTMTAAFSDQNETLYNGVSWDRLESIESDLSWGGVKRWEQIRTATSGERTAKQSVVQVGASGTTTNGFPATVSVPFDTVATYRVWHVDRGGLKSVVRSYTFTVPSGASVDEPTSPPARVENPTAPGNITAVYRSTGGVNCNRFMVKLVNASDSLIKESPGKDVSVAPGGTLSMTWAESTFSLFAGTTYGVRVNARDTNGNWSGYGPVHWFETNAAPAVPSIVTPSGAYVGSTRPLLQIDASDADKAVGALTVYVRFYDSFDVQQGGDYTATWNAATKRYELQTTSTHLPSLGTLRLVRATAFDGALYSGGAMSLGAATWSAVKSVYYTSAPTVTITAPAGPTIGTISPPVTWTCANQTAWRITLWDPVANMFVYDTGEQSGAAKNHTITTGAPFWKNGHRWNVGEGMYLRVLGKDGTTLWGNSADLYLALEYPPIDELIIDGEAMSYPGVDGTHYVHLHNSATTYPPGEFQAYKWSRQFITGEGGTMIGGTYREFAMQGNSGVLDVYDHDVPSGQWIRYWVTQSVLAGNDIIESPPVSIDLMCAWDGTLIHSNADPLSSYVWLRYGAVNDIFSPHMITTTGFRDVRLRGRRAPVAFSTGEQVNDPSGDYTFVPTEGKSAMDQLADLYRVARWQVPAQSPNGRPNGICWRSGRGDGRGEVPSLAYVRLVDIDANPRHTVESVSLTFMEYDFDPFEVAE